MLAAAVMEVQLTSEYPSVQTDATVSQLSSVPDALDLAYYCVAVAKMVAVEVFSLDRDTPDEKLL